MESSRFRMAAILLMISFLLCGFKQPARHGKPVSNKANPAEKKAKFKALDLSLPLSGYYFEATPQQLAVATQNEAHLFTGAKSGASALELKGQLIMTQEQEREKRRSADGAGIMINLRH